MYLRLVQFTLSEGSRGKAQAMADDLISAIKQQPGCAHAAFFRSAEDGASGICVFWDNQEHANAAAAVIGPKLEQHLAGNVASEPQRRLFPVLAS
jgi:quinol monooxygenase YgiN